MSRGNPLHSIYQSPSPRGSSAISAPFPWKQIPFNFSSGSGSGSVTERGGGGVTRTEFTDCCLFTAAACSASIALNLAHHIRYGFLIERVS